MPDISDLKEMKLFKDFGDAELKEIELYVTEEKRRRRDLIFSEGEDSDWFYFVRNGKVKITKLSADGKEIILEVIQPGDFFGGIAVVRGFPYPANAIAMEDCTLLKLSKANLLKLLKRFPGMMMQIVGSLGDRMKESHETTKSIALEKVEARIASLLLKLSEKTGNKTENGIEIDMKLTKQEIADMVGTTVETAIRTMSRLKKMGLIIEKAGKVIIIDPSGLESVSS